MRSAKFRDMDEEQSFKQHQLAFLPRKNRGRFRFSSTFRNRCKRKCWAWFGSRIFAGFCSSFSSRTTIFFRIMLTMLSMACRSCSSLPSFLIFPIISLMDAGLSENSSAMSIWGRKKRSHQVHAVSIRARLMWRCRLLPYRTRGIIPGLTNHRPRAECLVRMGVLQMNTNEPFKTLGPQAALLVTELRSTWSPRRSNRW